MVARSNRPAEVEPALLTGAQTGECAIWSNREMALNAVAWIAEDAPHAPFIKPVNKEIADRRVHDSLALQEVGRFARVGLLEITGGRSGGSVKRSRRMRRA
jgi:hypothetical protein